MATITPPPPTATRAPVPPPRPDLAPEEPPRGDGRTAKRLALGALIILLLGIAVGAAALSGEISTLRQAINQNPSLKVAPGTLASASSGGPQTLLLVGDDRRALTRYYHHAVASHSNEMLLVRFDPSKPWISMLSIPRELWVTIYPHNRAPVTNRINYAYTLGGTQLMTETIKKVIGLSVNHVVVIDFAHFRRAVDEMGCVYSTVDRRYYHSNVGSLEQYQEIDLQPGYQKLCGQRALEFVSYRHADTSLVRDARNQSFLLDVKKQYGPSLFANRDKFERIFGEAVQTDPALHTTSGLLSLLTLLAQSAGRPVRQVHFQVNLFPNYDTATPQQISSTVREFLHGNPTAPKRRAVAVAHAVTQRRFRVHLTLIPTDASLIAAARSESATLPFPLEYPRVRNQYALADPDALRLYSIRDEQGVPHRAYVVVISRGRVGQYYDVQGMDWSGAPVFSKPDQTIHVGNRTYELYYEGSTLRMVAWHEYGAVYWIRNTLTDDVPNSEMLAMAEETYPVSVHVAGPGRHRAGVGTYALPPRRPARAPGDLLEKLGAIGAIGAWLALALLAVRYVSDRRELRTLRQQMAHAAALEARQRALAASRGAAGGVPPPRPQARRQTPGPGISAGAPAPPGVVRS